MKKEEKLRSKAQKNSVCPIITSQSTFVPVFVENP